MYAETWRRNNVQVPKNRTAFKFLLRIVALKILKIVGWRQGEAVPNQRIQNVK